MYSWVGLPGNRRSQGSQRLLCSTLQYTATQHDATEITWGLEEPRQSVAVLYHIATHCNTLQHTDYNTLQQRLPGDWRSRDNQPVAILYHTATHCNTLQHTATQWIQHIKTGIAWGSEESRQSVTTLHTYTVTHCNHKNTLQHTETHWLQHAAREITWGSEESMQSVAVRPPCNMTPNAVTHTRIMARKILMCLNMPKIARTKEPRDSVAGVGIYIFI